MESNESLKEVLKESTAEPLKELTLELMEESTDESFKEVEQESSQNPVEELSKNPADGSSKDPTDESSKNSVEEPSKNPVEEPSKNPAEEPSRNPAEESIEKPMDGSLDDSLNKSLGQDDFCDSNPDFAVICSFIERFGSIIDLQLDIEHLKRIIEDRESLDDNLIDIHVKLLKKIRRYFVRDQWEKFLIKYAAEYSYEDAYEIERLGYLKTRPSIKIELLRRLLDEQFECDQKFKALVNSQEADELRLQPTGRDACGNTYWHSTDKEGNLRVFQDEPYNYKSWKAVCKSADELKQLIDKLESTKADKLKGEPRLEPYNPYTEIFPDLFVNKDDPVEDEESSTEDENNVSTNDSQVTKTNLQDDEEFACEEETNSEPVIINRARTARKSVAPNDLSIVESSTILEEDTPCSRCDKHNDPDCILLCDMCDDGYHLACCIPPLMYVPDGDWFCPSCEHLTLLKKLNEIHKSVTQILEAKMRIQMKRERLRSKEIKENAKNNTRDLVKQEVKNEFKDDVEDDFKDELISLETDEDEMLDMETDEDEMTETETDEAEITDTETDTDEGEMTDTETTTDIQTDGDSSIDEIVSSKYFKRTKRTVFYDSDESSEFNSKTRRCTTKKISYRESPDEGEPKPAPFYRDDEVWSPSSASPDRQRTW